MPDRIRSSFFGKTSYPTPTIPCVPSRPKEIVESPEDQKRKKRKKSRQEGSETRGRQNIQLSQTVPSCPAQTYIPSWQTSKNMPERNASTREKRAGPTRPPKEQRAKIDTKEEKDSITAASASASMTQDQTHDIDMSDDESVDLSAQDHGSPAESVKSGGDDAIKPESEGGTTQGDSEAAGPNMPVQKRRRVTRACDECRRKKIKCDGKQPCTHCSVYSYGSTSLPSHCFFYSSPFLVPCLPSPRRSFPHAPLYLASTVFFVLLR